MKLLKATLPRLWRLTRTTSMVVGLAVMVGLVAGVASLAVAQKTPSGGTTSSPLLKGVENVAAATTTLINSGTGPAMSMRVQPGNPPIIANPEAGTATNLSADSVDGKDSTAFVSATNGKAPDSELLDGKDSTEFLGAAAKAADSDKLDGKDSTDFAAASTGTAFTATQNGSVVTLGQSGHSIDTDILSKNVPAGSYAINAKVQLENKDENSSPGVGCHLQPAGENIIDFGGGDTLGEHFAANNSETIPLQGVVTGFGGGAITVRCGATALAERVEASRAVITAIRVGSVQ